MMKNTVNHQKKATCTISLCRDFPVLLLIIQSDFFYIMVYIMFVNNFYTCITHTPTSDHHFKAKIVCSIIEIIRYFL